MYNPFSLEGKTILVTGASSGIGKACAIECSKAGAKLFITGRNESRLNETLQALDGNEHVCITADISTKEGIEKMLSQIHSIDGAIFCAGVGSVIPIQFATPDKFADVFSINFNSPVEIVRLLSKKKMVNKGGSLVFISSVGGNYSFPKAGAIYGATKAALSSFMKYCAIEFAPKNIRSNSICPGMVETPLINDGPISQEQLEADRKNTYPLGRYGKPEEIAYGAIYLLSDASAWVTGHNLIIDGGGTIN